MKRMLVESALAIVIFSTANAVFGLNALVVRSLPGIASFASAMIHAVEPSGSQWRHRGNIGLPAPLDIKLTASTDYDRSFCLQPQFGAQPIDIRVQRQKHALVSNSKALPYNLSIELIPGHAVKGKLAGTVTENSCHGKGNVRVHVKLRKQALALLKHNVFADTVTLFVDPR